MLLVSLVVSGSAAATAAPAPGPLFSIESPTRTDLIRVDGSWRSVTPDGKVTEGQLPAAQLDLVTHDVDDSKWTLVPNTGASCGAITRDQTVYKARDKAVYVDRGCRKDHLDDASAQHLAQLTDIVHMLTSGGAKKAY